MGLWSRVLFSSCKYIDFHIIGVTLYMHTLVDALKITDFFFHCKATRLLQKFGNLKKYNEENKNNLRFHHTRSPVLTYWHFSCLFTELHICLKQNWDLTVNIVLQLSPFMHS